MRKRPDELYGISIMELQRVCGVSEKTAKRWKYGQTVPPESALRLLRGDLGCMDAQWRGWRFQGGDLVSPEGWVLTLGDARSAPFTRALVAGLQRENYRLRGIGESFKADQPEPGEIPAIVNMGI